MKNFLKSNRGFVSEILLVLVVLVSAKYFFDIDVVGYLQVWLEKGVEWVKNLKN